MLAKPQNKLKTGQNKKRRNGTNSKNEGTFLKRIILVISQV